MQTPSDSKDTVTITYSGRTEDGIEFDRATDDAPLTFTIGSGTVMPSIELTVSSMKEGETRRFILTPQQAFGEHKEELVQTLPHTAFGGNLPQPGMIVGLKVHQDGQDIKVPAMVMQVEKDQITVDYNHPLAGKMLEYTVTLKKRRPADS